MAIIFGRPVSEVKKSITYAEYIKWLGYRMKYGPINDVRRFDRPAALIASVLNQTFGGKIKMGDLMPYKAEKYERQATFEELVTALAGGKIAKPR